MNTYLKVILLLTGLILLSMGVIVYQSQRLTRLKEERNQVIEFANTDKANAVTFYKNKLDRETAKVEILNMSLRNTKALIEHERLSFVKQFEGVNKRLNNIEQISQTTAEIVREWHLPLRDTFLLNIDSTLLPAKIFSYRDSLNSISGTIIGNEIRPKIDILVPLQGVVYFQRNKFLGLRIGKKRWFSDVTTTNPYAKIQGHEFIKIAK